MASRQEEEVKASCNNNKKRAAANKEEDDEDNPVKINKKQSSTTYIALLELCTQKQECYVTFIPNIAKAQKARDCITKHVKAIKDFQVDSTIKSTKQTFSHYWSDHEYTRHELEVLFKSPTALHNMTTYTQQFAVLSDTDIPELDAIGKEDLYKAGIRELWEIDPDFDESSNQDDDEDDEDEHQDKDDEDKKDGEDQKEEGKGQSDNQDNNSYNGVILSLYAEAANIKKTWFYKAEDPSSLKRIKTIIMKSQERDSHRLIHSKTLSSDQIQVWLKLNALLSPRYQFVLAKSANVAATELNNADKQSLKEYIRASSLRYL